MAGNNFDVKKCYICKGQNLGTSENNRQLDQVKNLFGSLALNTQL